MEFNPIYSPSSQDIELAASEARSYAAEHSVSITGVGSEGSALVREALPDSDLESGGGNGWDGQTREWTQSGLREGELATVYTVDSSAKAEDKVLVFYAVSNLSSSNILSEIEWRDATGSTFHRTPISFTHQTSDQEDVHPETVVFSKLVVVSVSEDAEIAVYPTADGDANLVFRAAVAEPRGNTLTTKSSGGMDL